MENFMKNNINELTYISNKEDNTTDLAFSLAKHLNKTDVICLNGELGSGKTVFMQGIAKYFNILDQVSSPTFAIVNEYIYKDMKIYHFDVYRIENEDVFLETIGTEYFDNGLCIIEWGNIIKNLLPKKTIYIDITKIDEKKRKITFRRI